MRREMQTCCLGRVLEPRLDLQNNRDISLPELRCGFEVLKVVTRLHQ